jgi:hypothetical protein
MSKRIIAENVTYSEMFRNELPYNHPSLYSFYITDEEGFFYNRNSTGNDNSKLIIYFERFVNPIYSYKQLDAAQIAFDYLQKVNCEIGFNLKLQITYMNERDIVYKSNDFYEKNKVCKLYVNKKDYLKDQKVFKQLCEELFKNEKRYVKDIKEKKYTLVS